MEGMSAVGDGDGELTRETILQRHNYEMEEHRRKFPTASLGKKKRAEAARIEDEMRRRHGRELEELEERMAELMGNNETSGGDCEATAKDSDQDKSAVPEDATDGNGLTKEETGGVPAPKKKSKAQKRREQRAKEEVPSPTNHLHRCRIIAVNRPVGFFRERALWIEFDFQKIQPLHQSIAIHCFICLECQDIVDGDVLIFLKFCQRSSSAEQTNGRAHHRASTTPVGDIDEAERDARIAAEKANAGPSMREEELKKLHAMLLPKGFRIFEIPADGHCMFRAIANQLEDIREAVLTDSKTPERGECSSAGVPTILSSSRTFMELRALVANHMRRGAESYIPFVEDDLGDGDRHEAFEAYCEEIEATAKWGGQVELQALADAMSYPIEVYSADMPMLSLGKHELPYVRLPPIRLCYQRHAYGLGEHYNAVQPL